MLWLPGHIYVVQDCKHESSNVAHAINEWTTTALRLRSFPNTMEKGAAGQTTAPSTAGLWIAGHWGHAVHVIEDASVILVHFCIVCSLFIFCFFCAIIYYSDSASWSTSIHFLLAGYEGEASACPPIGAAQHPDPPLQNMAKRETQTLHHCCLQQTQEER